MDLCRSAGEAIKSKPMTILRTTSKPPLFRNHFFTHQSKIKCGSRSPRGDRDEAVFAAFKAVEEAVRKAGGFGPTDIGVELMRKAFDPAKGRLTDTTKPTAEREALAHLFAGAIGSYKNPHSHRTVSITDHKEAQEMVILASHLLRIIDGRTPSPPHL